LSPRPPTPVTRTNVLGSYTGLSQARRSRGVLVQRLRGEVGSSSLELVAVWVHDGRVEKEAGRCPHPHPGVARHPLGGQGGGVRFAFPRLVASPPSRRTPRRLRRETKAAPPENAAPS